MQKQTLTARVTVKNSVVSQTFYEHTFQDIGRIHSWLSIVLDHKRHFVYFSLVDVKVFMQRIQSGSIVYK